MNYIELTSLYGQVFKLVAENRIKEAIDTLGILADHCRSGDLKGRLEEHATTYANLLKYTFEGAGDPEREKVYNRLVRDLFSLADDLREVIIRNGQLLAYYRYSSMTMALADQFVQTLLDAIDPEIKDQQEVTHEQVSLFFTLIWHTDKLSDNQVTLLEQLSGSDKVPWYFKCMLVSGLTLSLIRHFDSHKFEALFRFYFVREKQVWQRALVGLVFALSFYDDRLTRYPDILKRMGTIEGSLQTNRLLELVFIQYLKSLDTEKITRKIQQEIIPEMMRIKSKLEDRLDLENLLSSGSSGEKNPEWESVFIESKGAYAKMEEFTSLQMEGADVFLGAFAMLKQFEFFRDTGNWFMPFYKDNPQVADSFANLAEAFDVQQFLVGLERSHFLCNSDKYSFCLNIRHMPLFQKSTMMELFNMELKAMNEMAEEDEMLQAESLNRIIITQYFHDLYRFCKLHPMKSEFTDLFNLPQPIYKAGFVGHWIGHDHQVMQNIGEYFFSKDRFEEALDVFISLSGHNHSPELIEKIAFCHQQLQQYSEALDYYHKAEITMRNPMWLMTRIAWCYRKLGRYDRALYYYHEAEKLNRDDLQVQASLGQAYIENGQFEEALKHYFKVEYLQPENRKVLRPIAWCSFMLGRLDNARKYFEKSLQVDANRNDSMNLGHIFWCQGEKQKARELYKQALRISRMDYKWFNTVMSDDSRYLIQYGITPLEISLLHDYLRLPDA